MSDKLNWLLKNGHLLISTLIVIPTAIIYSSPKVLSSQLDIQVQTIDLENLLKGIAGLYLGVSIIWILGVWKSTYWKSATRLNALFMLTLAAGRIFSVMTDGLPTNGYLFGLVAELFLGVLALYQLKKYS